MKNIVFLFLFLFLNCNAQTVGLTQNDLSSLNNGYVLFAPISSTTTYLIDKCGKQVKTWPSTYRPALSCYLSNDGSLLRTGNTNNTIFNAGGKGGIIQKIDWSGNVIWNYLISSNLECQHHDIKELPNGNVLVIVWDSKTNTEAIAKGRNPTLVSTTVWSEKIIEIQPTGLTTGNVIWEWHLWDHLVQDFDNSKPNFASINTNPQLVNINYQASVSNTDWIHLNSIDYNPSLDQILVSSHSFDEVWIIDHSTTTVQASSHLGGNSGKGGDILYRWGNPRAYNNGSVADQKLFGQHDATWIENSLSFANQIMIFNNGNGRTGGNYSTIEIINPPVNGNIYTNTLPYLPNNTSWNYNTGNPNNLYAQNISSSQQISNGSVLYCDGPNGIFTEINSNGTSVWKYINPVTNTGITNQGQTNVSPVFKCIYYPSSFTGFTGQNLVSGNTIENTNTLSASCTLSSNDFDLAESIQVYPNPAKDFITIKFENNYDSTLEIEIFNNLGQKVIKQKIDSNQKIISLESLKAGIFVLKIISENKLKTFKIIKE
jgi:hypothetical protein